MTTGNLFLDCFIGGLIGMLCHVFFVKLPALKKRSENANMGFSPAHFFKTEWITLGASLLTVVVAVFVVDEIIKLRPSIVDYLKFFFIFIGYTGSSILIGAFGKTEKTIQDIVNIKTNIADEKNHEQ